MGDRVDLPLVDSPGNGIVAVAEGKQDRLPTPKQAMEIAHRCNVHRELVEALEATKANLELARMHFDGDVSSMMFDSIQNAEAALAKTRGE